MSEIIEKLISELTPYINNARTHSEDQIKQIAESINVFGFTNPLLIDKNGGIIAGHGRATAALKIGMDKVPTICLDGLSEVQIKAYILADNKLAENAGWDFDLISSELKELQDMDFDIDLLGFSLDDLELNNFESVDIDEQGKIDELTPHYVNCPKCGYEFDAKA